MIRLGIILVVVLYATLIIVPGADYGEERGAAVDVTRASGQNWLVSIITGAEQEARTPPATIPDAAARGFEDVLAQDLVQTDDGFALQTAEGDLLAITAIINPVELLPQDGQTQIAAVSVVDPGALEVSREQVAAARAIWRVTGNNVNFRAGPSTNTAVLAGLVRGDEVEFLADAADGWAHLRVVSTGLEGYMAARFLEPVN